jgi:hypothetical protein
MSETLWAILIGLMVPMTAIFGGLVIGMWLGWRERKYQERRTRRRARHTQSPRTESGE